MKRSAYLVNTARGPVVDEAALVWALAATADCRRGARRLRERAGCPSRLAALENVLLVPHLASATTETRTAMANLAVDNVAAVLAGRRRSRRSWNEATPRGSQAAATEPVMRALARAIDGLELPAVEKISAEPGRGSLSRCSSRRCCRRARRTRRRWRRPTGCSASRARRARWRSSTVRQIERLIYPVSFYRHKARHVKATCRILVERFGGRVPTTMEELLTLPGVGRKTANLVLILAFKSLKNICVDTHVHRISNRLGWVRRERPRKPSRRSTSDTRTSDGGRTSTCIW